MRRTLALALVSALALPALIAWTPAVPSAIAAGSASTAAAVLAGLPVATPVASGYDRDLFEHWIDADGNGCDTRQEVLIAESAVPVTKGSGCTIVGGRWNSWYDGAVWTAPSDVDIDHMVPLSEAWKSGASLWTADQRRAFANDLGFAASLVGVTDNVNASKSDSDPAVWVPPLADSSVQCDYATNWVLVKYRWGLAVDAAEKTALSTTLSGSCGSAAVALPTIAAAAAAPVADPTTTQSIVYRFWSPTHQTHFYTMNVAERDSIIHTYPAAIWTYEGPRYQAFATQQPGTVPLYRFWSPRMNGHFFTANEAEKNSVIKIYDDATWTYEMIAYYVYPTDSTVANTVPVARFWSTQFQHHFYTASAEEKKSVDAYPKHIWSFENYNYRVPASVGLVDPPVTAAPVVTPPVVVTPPAPSVYYKNCDAVRAAGKAPLFAGQPGYETPRLDRDGDGIACE